MKSYHEVARDVFRRRDEMEREKRRREAICRRVSAAMSAVAVVVMLLLSAGTCYVLAAGVGIIEDFLHIFGERADAPLSDGQKQYLEEGAAMLGESVTSGGYTVTAKGAFTDGTVALVLLDVEAPEGVVIDGIGVGFEVGAKEIVRGENTEKYLNITGLSITQIPMEDYDGKDNTASLLLQISCVRLPGSAYTFADGYLRYLELEDLHDYMEGYPYSRRTIAEGSWRFQLLFTETQAGEIELLEAPIRMPIRRAVASGYADATVSSIRLKGLGATIYYTVDGEDPQEAGDFGDVQIVMKDGSIVNAYPKAAVTVANGTPGHTTFCNSYIAGAPIVFDEVDHMIIGEELIVSVPNGQAEEQHP